VNPVERLSADEMTWRTIAEIGAPDAGYLLAVLNVRDEGTCEARMVDLHRYRPRLAPAAGGHGGDRVRDGRDSRRPPVVVGRVRRDDGPAVRAAGGEDGSTAAAWVARWGFAACYVAVATVMILILAWAPPT
jgi:hypothetical protein